MIDHFGEKLVAEARAMIAKEEQSDKSTETTIVPEIKKDPVILINSAPSRGFSMLSKKSERLTFGLNSNMIGVGRGDMFFFDYVVAKHNQFKEFVEFGTFGGVTSLYIGIMARLRGANFYTFDISDKRIECIRNNWLEHVFYEGRHFNIS